MDTRFPNCHRNLRPNVRAEQRQIPPGTRAAQDNGLSTLSLFPALAPCANLAPFLLVPYMATVLKAIKSIASGKGAPQLRPPANLDSADATQKEVVFLPNGIPKQYPPLILVHVLLLFAALLLLPQTPLPDIPLPPPTRGLDKPQHHFLAPITARPVLTLAWACLGATLLVPWWAGSLRRWVHDGTLGPRSMQQRLRGDPHKRRVRPVSSSSVFISQSYFLYAHTGHLECVSLYRVHCTCVARSDRFIRSAICPVCICPTSLRPHSPYPVHFPSSARYVPHTALLAFLLAIYTVFPPAFTLGPPRLGLPLLSSSASGAIAQNELWIRIFVERKQVSSFPLNLVPRLIMRLFRRTKRPAERCLLYPTYGAYLGAWLGVIPIGLDWDRPWQVYNLPRAR